MKICSDLPTFHTERQHILPTLTIGHVPTMGALHEGHASLVRQSVQENDLTIASIFVNPTQFGPNEDYTRYPRTLEEDSELLASLGVDIIFAPKTSEIYQDRQSQFTFQIRDLDKKLCGASRPGHMNGVAQVVTILFHIVQPTRAYFGLKDYQQCLILQRMVKELHFPLTIVPCPIIREPDGLALSSRNIFLSPEERKQALFLSQTLQTIQKKRNDFSSIEQVKDFVSQQQTDFPLVRLDYFEVLHGHTLAEIEDLSPQNMPVAFIAAFLGKTRLIDNLKLF